MVYPEDAAEIDDERDNNEAVAADISDDSVLEWPLPDRNKNITHGFGDPWAGNPQKRHTGIDVDARPGTPVFAIDDGDIVRRAWLGMNDDGENWGDAILISHDNDSWVSCYLHLDSKISRGDSVLKGDTIGYVDNNRHLHFSIWNAPHERIAVRGALPQNSGYDDPVFPQQFIDPLRLRYE
jgi:murein DD-endopeptidase MepM/ murein hydrolase activator NlpD